MDFNGSEVNALYANHSWKRTTKKTLINKEKNKKKNPYQITSLHKLYPSNTPKKANQEEVKLNISRPARPFFASSLSKKSTTKHEKDFNLSPLTARQNSFYLNIQFLSKLRSLMIIYFCRYLLSKKQELKDRLKRSKLCAKNSKAHQIRCKRKKQLKQEQYRFFTMKKPSLSYKEARVGLNSAIKSTISY